METTTYACPVEGCEIFPYEDPAELEAHLAEAAHPHGPYTAFNASSDRRPPLASGTGKSTSAAAAPPECTWSKVDGRWFVRGPVNVLESSTAVDVRKANNTVVQVAIVGAVKRVASERGHQMGIVHYKDDRVPGPSPKQVAFFERLCQQKGVDPEAPVSKADMSKAIDSLLRMSDAVATPARTEVPVGLHFLGGNPYKVVMSKAGRPYALKLVDGSWSYDAARGAMRQLDETTVMALEQAQQFGQLTGTCCCCGRELTNPESIERGIGPICRSKWF